MRKVFVGLPVVLACAVGLGSGQAGLGQSEVMMQGLAQPLYSLPDLNRQLQLNPNSDNYKNRADAYRKAGLRKEAVDDLTQALSLEPADAAAHFQRGFNYFEEGMYQEAVHDCSSAIKIDGKFAEAYVMRAQCYNKLKQWQKAVNDCTTALSLKPQLVEAMIQRGIAYDAMKKSANAIADLSNAVNASAKDERAYYYRADAYQSSGDYQKALDDYTEALKLNPHYRRALLARAWCNYKLGNDAQAAEDCSKAVRFDPAMQMAFNKYIGEKENNPVIVPDADYKFGSEINDDLKNALSLLNNVLKDKPGDSDALRDRGVIYMHLAKYSDASRDFDAANAGVKAPEGSEFPGFGSQDDYNKALALYKQANDLLSGKNYAGAIDQYSAALKVYPQFGKCWHNLAIAYGYTGDYFSAELACIQAVSYRPDDWKLWNTLGFEMYQEFQRDKSDPNKLDAAGAALRHSLALNPPNDGDKHDVRTLLAAVNNYERSLAPANYVVVTTMPLN